MNGNGRGEGWIWIDGEVGKGYVKEDFQRVFKRYMTKAEVEDLRVRSERWMAAGA